MRRFNSAASILSDSPRISPPVIRYSIAIPLAARLHVDLHHRPHFGRSVLRRRYPRRNRIRLIDILRLDQHVSAKLLLGFRERPVRDRRLAVAYTNRRGRLGELERATGLALAALHDVLRERIKFLEDLPLLRFRPLRGLFFVVINQKHEFHNVLHVSQTARTVTAPTYSS